MIEVVAETGSTSADLSARIASGEVVEDGHWLVADRQSAGRGRQGRIWSDGAGNFMGSTAVNLRAGDPPAHTLSLVTGVATFAAIEAVAPGIGDLRLKWPNDLLVGEAKLAGILLERRRDTVVIGVGVNLATEPPVSERSVASLAEQGFIVPRDAFSTALERCWADALQRWRGSDWNGLRQDWIVRAHPVGTPLTVHGPDSVPVRGTFAGLDEEGALQLLLSNGTRRIIHAGEVFLDRR